MAAKNFFLFLTLGFLSSTIAMKLSKITPVQGRLTNSPNNGGNITEILEEIPQNSPITEFLKTTAFAEIGKRNRKDQHMYHFTRGMHLVTENEVVDSLAFRLDEYICEVAETPEGIYCKTMNVTKQRVCAVERHITKPLNVTSIAFSCTPPFESSQNPQTSATEVDEEEDDEEDDEKDENFNVQWPIVYSFLTGIPQSSSIFNEFRKICVNNCESFRASHWYYVNIVPERNLCMCLNKERNVLGSSSIL